MLVNIFGKRGAGKTTTIRGLLKDCKGPVVVADILGNFDSEEYVQCDSLNHAIREIGGYIRNPKEENKIIVVKAADPDLTVDYLSAALWRAEGGTLVLDEADGFSLTNAPCFDQLIRYGRNKGVDVVTGCRRPAEISRNITAGANKILAFRTQEPRDIDYFRATVFGDRAFDLMEVEQFSGLFVDYDRNEIGRFKIDESGNVFKLEANPIDGNAKNKGREK